jgi:hypothetical protein
MLLAAFVRLAGSVQTSPSISSRRARIEAGLTSLFKGICFGG